MTVLRPIWMERLHQAWQKKSIVWLAGVRRSGKTTLAKQLEDSVYFNCDLPRTQTLLSDPEIFFREHVDKKILVLDEIHQLPSPSQVLKIAADEFPNLKILATGSSTLAATNKFTDQLTDRKRTVRLVPVLPEECPGFGIQNLQQRILLGGLPPALLRESPDPEFYSDWMDSFYARDIQEIFRVEKRTPFIDLLELVLSLNGSLIEASKLGSRVGLSRPTVIRYLETLETTCAITIVRPFHGSGRQEIVSQPKIYGFDTGFVCYAKQIHELRTDDCGTLLENLVLESLMALPKLRNIHFWRTKHKQEVDFVLPVSSKTVHAVECKWDHEKFQVNHLERFREDYPNGENFLVCSNAPRTRVKEFKSIPITVVNILDFRKEISKRF